MKEFWRDAGLDERIFIVFIPTIIVGFVIGWGFLLKLAYHLDALDRLAK